MQVAFRVTLDIASDPCILQSQRWTLGDLFIRTAAIGVVDNPCVFEVKAILTQLLPDLPYPASRPADVYLIADGLVISSDKVTKVE